MNNPLFDRFAVRHLREVGEGYFEHASVALHLALRMFTGAFAALIHGIVPNVFQSTASGVIRELGSYLELRQRRGRRHA